jgi:hypothetical protein
MGACDRTIAFGSPCGCRLKFFTRPDCRVKIAGRIPPRLFPANTVFSTLQDNNQQGDTAKESEKLRQQPSAGLLFATLGSGTVPKSPSLDRPLWHVAQLAMATAGYPTYEESLFLVP